MKRSGFTVGLAFLATGFLLGCQETRSNPMSTDVPGPSLHHRPGHDGGPGGGDDDGGGGGPGARTVDLTGGFVTEVGQPVELKETGTEVRLTTHNNDDIFIDYGIALPGSADVDFAECEVRGDLDLADAAAFWEDFVTAAVADGGAVIDANGDLVAAGSWTEGRIFTMTIFKKDGGGKSGSRWFTWSDANHTGDKQTWHIRVGSDDALGVQGTGSWDPTNEIAEVGAGSIALGWVDCGDDSQLSGCKSFPGQSRKTVACRNGAAFAEVFFTADVQ